MSKYRNYIKQYLCVKIETIKTLNRIDETEKNKKKSSTSGNYRYGGRSRPILPVRMCTFLKGSIHLPVTVTDEQIWLRNTTCVLLFVGGALLPSIAALDYSLKIERQCQHKRTAGK